jgi:hypothetical protein
MTVAQKNQTGMRNAKRRAGVTELSAASKIAARQRKARNRRRCSRIFTPEIVSRNTLFSRAIV